ncbi:MAG TPA: hypothetical protein VIX37_11130 [Candidatus Sulfotelmatobacter sp.]
MSTLANPFHVWAQVARGLRDRFVAELGEKRPYSPYTGHILGMLAATITRCEHMGIAVRHLQEKDPDALAAFLRALGKP